MDRDNAFLKTANTPSENAFKEDPHHKTKVKTHLETSADGANRKEAKICLVSLDVGNSFNDKRQKKERKRQRYVAQEKLLAMTYHSLIRKPTGQEEEKCSSCN